jgi:hypothetical protein
MIAAALLTICLALWLAGDTPIGRAMRRVLVDAPARILSKVHRGQWLMLLALLCVGGVLGWLTEGEAVRLMMMGAPDLMAMLASVELSAFVDVLAVAVATASTVRFRTIAAHVRGMCGGRNARARRTRTRVERALPANDDEDRSARRAAA